MNGRPNAGFYLLGGGEGGGEGSTPNSTSSPKKFLNIKLLKVHKGVNYACTHNFKYTYTVLITFMCT